MLEFVFRAEKSEENYPKVVLLSEKWQQDIERLGEFDLQEQQLLLQNLEPFAQSLKKGQAAKFVINGRIFVVLSCKECDEKETGSKIYKEIADFQKVCVLVAQKCKLDIEKFALGLEYAAYSFDKYKTTKKSEDFGSLETILFPQFEQPQNWKKVVAWANGVRYARDLGNEPGNFLTPEIFALDIKRLEYLDIRVDLYDFDFIKKSKMGLIEAVAKGSSNQAYVAVMQYIGNPKQKDWTLGLVGKGVTYDSGGISLKLDNQQPGEKKDMCGAAAVVSALKVAALQKLPVNLVAILPLVENMPAANAYKPDDVLTSMSTKTVEIVDTDAEGRLILADALWLLQERFGVKRIIDVATLTGSTAYIFAGFYAALLGNDDDLMAKIKKAAEISGEKVWQLPLEKKIDERLKSEVADLKQLGKKEADSTQAACFLQHFIKKGVRWAHLDIAGCETDGKGNATGFGVVLLSEIITLLMEKK